MLRGEWLLRGTGVEHHGFLVRLIPKDRKTLLQQDFGA